MNREEIQHNWKRVIPQLDDALEQMNKRHIMAVGFGIYARIIPALFLDNYSIYVVRDTTDIDVFENYGTIHSHAKLFKDSAKRTRSTNYLINGKPFLSFLKQQKQKPSLLFYHSTHAQEEIVQDHKLDWIGNPMTSFESVLTKGNFRNVLEALNIPHMERWTAPREEFLNTSFEQMHARWNTGVVIQRSDTYYGEEQSTYFARTEEEWNTAQESLARDTNFTSLQISPFIVGNSLSMLGCVTSQGVLSGTLQLQFVDVPESFNGQETTGTFCGHDFYFNNWTPELEQQAQHAIETIGAHLAGNGYKGMFGIDFLHDPVQQKLYPIECNPRFTGTIPVYSAMTYGQGEVPPIEFFHLLAQLDIDVPFDFEAVNAGWKARVPVSHISLSPEGVYEMKQDWKAGIYTFDYEKKALQYQRAGGFSWECDPEKGEFVLVDSVPRQGQPNQQTVPRLFKLVFPESIAVSTHSIDPKIAELMTWMNAELRKNQPDAPDEHNA